MANDEVLGPRKTMFVLVIVVGCFAVLWPRILSPLILGSTSEQLKPNKFDRDAAIKQERSPIRMGPHPALLERGRAIPPGPPPPARPVVLPPHVRVRSPLSVYYDLDIKPPPIPGMRPPLGSPGGPVAAPKSSMGFVMPIYTICIIVFFVYTLSKILFKRTGAPYDPVAPDPQFRRRVFRDDSRTSPDKLGHKETDTRDAELAALKARLAETERAMQRIVGQLARRDAESLDNARPYTNGTVLLNNGPVQIVASEYRDPKEKSPERQKDNDLSLTKSDLDHEKSDLESKEKEILSKSVEITSEPDNFPVKAKECLGDNEIPIIESANSTNTHESPVVPIKSVEEVDIKLNADAELNRNHNNNEESDLLNTKQNNAEKIKSTREAESGAQINENDTRSELLQISEETEINIGDNLDKLTDNMNDEVNEEEKRERESTPQLLADAIKYDSIGSAGHIDDRENQSVKVVGMEVTAHPADGGAWRPEPPRVAPPPNPHKAEDVKSIFLDTEIPQQSRVLISDFAEDRPDKPKPSKNAPLVVSGKITLSLIQDAPRDTPDRDPESTLDDYTTASGLTQPAEEKEDDLSDEEIEEEIEVEEIEEIEEIEEEEDEEEEPKDLKKK